MRVIIVTATPMRVHLRPASLQPFSISERNHATASPRAKALRQAQNYSNYLNPIEKLCVQRFSNGPCRYASQFAAGGNRFR